MSKIKISEATAAIVAATAEMSQLETKAAAAREDLLALQAVENVRREPLARLLQARQDLLHSIARNKACLESHEGDAAEFEKRCEDFCATEADGQIRIYNILHSDWVASMSHRAVGILSAWLGRADQQLAKLEGEIKATAKKLDLAEILPPDLS